MIIAFSSPYRAWLPSSCQARCAFKDPAARLARESNQAITGAVSLSRLPLPVLETLFVLAWSSGFIGARLTLSVVPIYLVMFWRFVLLSVALSPLILRAWRQGALTRPQNAACPGRKERGGVHLASPPRKMLQRNFKTTLTLTQFSLTVDIMAFKIIS